MPYQTDMTFNDWAGLMTAHGSDVVNAIENTVIMCRKFYSVTYGLSDAQIILLPGWTNRTVNDIMKLRYAISAFNDLYQALNNGAIGQRDRLGDLTPFL